MLIDMCVHLPLWTHLHTPTPYEHLWGTGPLDLEVDEVIIEASLLTDMPPTTKRYRHLIPKINLDKCEQPYQI
jgi:hypothetical protein